MLDTYRAKLTTSLFIYLREQVFSSLKIGRLCKANLVRTFSDPGSFLEKEKRAGQALGSRGIK